jgi:DNA-binding CsgD family transcriptional regulator
MDVQVIGAAKRAAREPGLPGVSNLVSLLGSTLFPVRLFSELRKLCGCAHFVALTSAGQAPIKVVFALNEGETPVALAAAEKYVAGYWRHDPINAILPNLGSADVSARTTPHDIGLREYRKDCYSAPNLIERLSILRSRNHVTTRIYLYRSEDAGQFASREVEAITGASSLLLALVDKHSEMAGDALEETEAGLRRRVGALAPDMPRREVDVCVGIVRGQTSEAIALGLKVSINTVLTYRKRAYSRLGISSQNELMRRLSSSRRAWAGERAI